MTTRLICRDNLHPYPVVHSLTVGKIYETDMTRKEFAKCRDVCVRDDTRKYNIFFSSRFEPADELPDWTNI